MTDRDTSGLGTRVPGWAWWLVIAMVGLAAGGVPLLWGPPGGDDAYHHAMLTQQQARCLAGGVPWPTWYPDLNAGLGGPEPRTRPIIPLTAHALLALVFDDAVAAISLVTLLIPVAIGLSVGVAGRRLGASHPNATVAGVVAALLPYLAFSLHERISLQEGWALALLPQVLVAFDAYARRSSGLVSAAGLLAAMSGTHLLVTITTIVLLAMWAAGVGRQALARVGGAGLAGLGIGALFWVSGLVALGRVQSGTFVSDWFDWRERFVLLPSPSDPRLGGAMTATFVGIVLAATVAMLYKGKARRFGILALILAALATPLAWPLYQFVPGFAFIQFPWRWLGPSGLVLALGIAFLDRWILRAAVAGCALLPLTFFHPSFDRAMPGGALRPSAGPAEAAAAATRFFVPPILPSFPAMVPRGVVVDRAMAAAGRARRALPAAVQSGPALWRWDVNQPGAGNLVLPLLADPGWSVRVDGHSVGLTSTSGLLTVPIRAGEHVIECRQGWLPENWFGLGFSLLSAGVLAGWIRSTRRRGEHFDEPSPDRWLKS